MNVAVFFLLVMQPLDIKNTNILRKCHTSFEHLQLQFCINMYSSNLQNLLNVLCVHARAHMHTPFQNQLLYQDLSLCRVTRYFKNTCLFHLRPSLLKSSYKASGHIFYTVDVKYSKKDFMAI